MIAARLRPSQIAMTLIGGIGCFAVVLPVLYAISISFRTRQDIVVRPAVLIPPHFTLNSYLEMWRAFPVGRYLLNSAFLSLGTTVITVAVAAFAGYGFARFRFRFQDQ